MSGRRKVLFLLHRAPWPADKGDRVRSLGILRHLAQSHDVWLGAPGDDGDDAGARDAERALSQWCAEVRVVARPLRIAALRALWTGRPASCEALRSGRLTAWTSDVAARIRFDAVLGFSGQSAEAVLALRAPRRVVDLCDADSAKWAARAAATRNPLWSVEARRVRALEQRCLRELDGVTVATTREADLLGGAGARLRVVPTALDLTAVRPRAADPGGARIGFVGALDYPPNAEGALWFARSVLPEIRAQRPNAEFVVIGRDPPAALNALPGVRTTGWVEDVRTELDACALAVVPILTSHGIQSKAVLALAAGVPQVVSPAAAEGLGATPDTHVVTAASARDFTAAVLRLLDNPHDRARLATGGRALAEARFDVDRVLAPLDDLLFGGLPAP